MNKIKLCLSLLFCLFSTLNPFFKEYIPLIVQKCLSFHPSPKASLLIATCSYTALSLTIGCIKTLFPRFDKEKKLTRENHSLRTQNHELEQKIQALTQQTTKLEQKNLKLSDCLQTMQNNFLLLQENKELKQAKEGLTQQLLLKNETQHQIIMVRFDQEDKVLTNLILKVDDLSKKLQHLQRITLSLMAKNKVRVFSINIFIL